MSRQKARDRVRDRTSGRGRGRTCSVLGLAATNLQHNPEKNCEQFPKKKIKKAKKMQLFAIIVRYGVPIVLHSKSKLNQISQWSTN